MKEIYGAYKVSGIYKITSMVHPDRCYIGSSKIIWFRWNEHKRLLRRGEHESPTLQNHFNKYGMDDLGFTIIEQCTPEELIVREQYYIDSDQHRGYFNICKTAGNCLGTKQSEETRRKRRESNLGKKRPPRSKEHCERISEGKKGIPSPLKGVKRKMPPWCKGKTGIFSEETLKKLRAPRPQSSENIKKSWVKRKEEGKVGERDEFGRFKKKGT